MALTEPPQLDRNTRLERAEAMLREGARLIEVEAVTDAALLRTARLAFAAASRLRTDRLLERAA